MAKDPVAAAAQTPPVIVTKEEVLGEVETAMAGDETDPGPRSITIQRRTDGKFTVTVVFD